MHVMCSSLSDNKVYIVLSFISGEQNFIKQLMNFDKDNITDRVLKKIGQYCSQADFQPEIIGRVSSAAKSLCMWVRAMEVYGRIYRVVEPKRQRLNTATSQLQEKAGQLAAAKDKLAEVSLCDRHSDWLEIRETSENFIFWEPYLAISDIPGLG